MWVVTLHNCLCTLTLPYPVTHPPNGSCYFEPNLVPYHFLFLVHSAHIYLPVKMGQISEASAYKLQTPGNYTKESIQHTEHGERLKSRRFKCINNEVAIVGSQNNVEKTRWVEEVNHIQQTKLHLYTL